MVLDDAHAHEAFAAGPADTSGSAANSRGARGRRRSPRDRVPRPRSRRASTVDGSTVCTSCSTAPTARRSRARRTCSAPLGARGRRAARHPDGTNINAGCGSTDPGRSRTRCRARGRRSASRSTATPIGVIAVDEHGAVVDGDQIMAVCAHDLAARGRLAGNAVVGHGVCRTSACTRPSPRPASAWSRHRSATATCSTAMERRGLVLGGEQSGHVIFRDRASTGDGTLDRRCSSPTRGRRRPARRPLSPRDDAALPQVLRNVPVARTITDADDAQSARARSRPRSVSSANGAGWSCARRAPSRWCG